MLKQEVVVCSTLVYRVFPTIDVVNPVETIIWYMNVKMAARYAGRLGGYLLKVNEHAEKRSMLLFTTTTSSVNYEMGVDGLANTCV